MATAGPLTQRCDMHWREWPCGIWMVVSVGQLEVLHEDVPHGDDVTDRTYEHKEVEHRVHEATAV